MAEEKSVLLLSDIDILIVEDSLLVAIDIEMTLISAGARAMIATSLALAMELIDSHRFDFVLVDYELGHETSERLLERLVEKRIPRIILTGYDAVDVGPLGEGSMILMKPQPPQNLALRIAVQLGRNGS